jgi:NitT/TauT family transport system substrate-binding protein
MQMCRLGRKTWGRCCRSDGVIGAAFAPGFAALKVGPQPYIRAEGLMMKLAVPDLISNSYFPAAAAVELGLFAQQGLDVSLELIFPVDRAYRCLQDGEVDFVGGSAHSALAAFPGWKGCKLLCAQAQGMYWFLVMHADLKPLRGDLAVVKGRQIGAAPWVEMGLRRLLNAAGIDPQRDDVTIAPVPGATGANVNFGLTAAQALEERKIDGFWANGMGTEVAVRRGVGAIVLDIRRGDGPAHCFNYTMASIAATDRLIHDRPEAAAGAIRAIVAAHAALRSDPGLARKIGARLFPPQEADLIEGLIRRDLPYYDASISPNFVNGMNEFAHDIGILEGHPSYTDVVATQFAALWKA